MVLNSPGKIKEYSGKLLLLLILLLVLVLVINFCHLIWYIADPDGFWGFAYFLELLRVGFIVLAIVIFASFLLIVLFSYLISSFRNGFNKKEFLKGIGLLALILCIPLLNYLFSNGAFLYISGILSDKYGHLETTQKHLNRGELKAACEYAREAYDKEMQREEIASFFFLSRWYATTDLDRSKRLTDKYSAIISYAVCLKETPGSEEEAEILLKKAMKISSSEVLREEKASYQSFPLMALAEIHLQKGEYLKAEEYFEELENFHESLDSEDIEYQLQGRMFFADRALRVGDFDKAAQIFLENVQLFEQSSDDTDSQYYLALLVMASLTETHQGNYESAIDLLSKANQVAEEQEDSLFYPNFLIAKANLLYHAALNELDARELLQPSWWDTLSESFKNEQSLQKQMLTEAEALYGRALEEMAEKSGPNNYQYLSILLKQGEFFYNTGESEQAEKVFGLAEELLRPVKNENQDLYNQVQLSNLRLKENTDYSLITQVEDQIFQRISANFLFLTEEEKESFISKIASQLHVLNSIYVRENTFRANKRLYNNILATKQLALNSSRQLRQFLSQAPEELKKEYEEILQEKEKLLNIRNPEEHAQLSSTITDKERNLMSRIRQETNFSAFEPRTADWAGLQKELDEREVAIEIFSLPERSSLIQEGEEHYFALVLKKSFEAPQLLPLFTETELENLLSKQGGTRERVNEIYGSGKQQLLDLIWKPLSGLVEDTPVVYLSVSGLLHQVSFPALMLDQPWEFHLLGTTRDIPRLKSTSSANGKNIALFGDADFESVGSQGYSRSFNTVDEKIGLGLQTGYFPDLQYTRQEIDSIEAIFRNVPGILTKYEGLDASEKAFRDMDKNNYQIIHLATHGFYFEGNTRVFSQASNLLGESFGPDNPMYRSGVLLSGSRDPQPSKNNDGILTAFEISRMDLSGVDLMVLSACETARGDLGGGEGVFGLQRALKLAGVRDQILSLWQVPDQQTSELFKTFYENYALGHSTYKSLKMAQEQLSKEYPPFYWAGFVLLE